MFKIIFSDQTIFIGGESTDSKWNTMPNKPIKKLEYKLKNKTINLENYHAYNHLVEKVCFLNGKQKITKIILMAKKDDNVLLLVYDFIKNKFYYDAKTFGREYNNKPTSGWKQGVLNKEPKVEII